MQKIIIAQKKNDRYLKIYIKKLGMKRSFVIDRKGTISQSITSFFLILKSNNDFF